MAKRAKRTPAEARELALTAVDAAVRTESRLSQATHLIDAFLLPSSWTLENASECGYVRLMERLLSLEWAGVSDQFRRLRFEHAVSRLTSPNCCSLSLVEWWTTRYLSNQEAYIVECALQNGSVETLEWLELQGVCVADHTQDTVTVSADSSVMAYWLHDHVQNVRMALHLNVNRSTDPTAFVEFVRWSLQHREQYVVIGVETAMDLVASYGRLKDLRWLHAQASEGCGKQALGSALANGHLSTAKWLYQHYPSGYFDKPSGAKCDLKLLKWIADTYDWLQWRDRDRVILQMLTTAMESGETAAIVLKVMQLLHSVRSEHGDLVDPRYPDDRFSPWPAAAANGYMEVLQWLHLNDGGSRTTRAMDQAAANGRLDVVKWLHRNRPEGCTIEAMSGAIKNNHLDVVRWLHENRSEGYDPTSMDAAAAHGHLEMVQWLHLNRTEGCTADAMALAAVHGHLEIVKWLHENRSEGCSDYAMDSCAMCGQLEALKYLHKHRLCKWTKRAYKAIEYDRLDVMRWLVEMDPLGPLDQTAVRQAAEKGHAAIVALFVPRYCDLDWDCEFLNSLARYGQFAILEWALRLALLRPDQIRETLFLKR